MDTNTPEPAQQPLEAVPVSVGKVLREARLSQGLSVADVAGSIKFAPRQVEALESDDFAHLPELAFVRGFIRSYARLLGIDDAPLLAALPHAEQKLASSRSDLADMPASASQATRRLNSIWLVASLGVAIVLGVAIWIVQDKPVQKQAEIQPQVMPVPETLVVSSVAMVSMPVAAMPPVVPAKLAASSQSASAPGEVKPVPAVASKLKSGPVHLVFDEDSWVEVTDGTSKTLLRQTNPAKSEQWLKGTPPYSLVIGNASGVHLYYEGDEIDLSEFTDVAVARLILE